MSVVATAPTSPWKGLAPFEDNDLDALLFFGREREQEVIASNLIASRLTVLYGPSGVGKSSVLRAGVAYRLRAAAQRSIEELGHPDLAVVVFDDWRGDPVHDLREAVREALGRLFGPYAVPEVEPDASLAATFAAWTQGLDCELLLILDQVEEYFVYHADEEADEPFADQLPELVTTRGIRVNALVSLREDALAKLDRFKARIPNVFSNYLRLDRLPRSAARTAIVGPLARYNELVGPAQRMAIEPSLVDAVIEETTAGRVALDEESSTTRDPADAGEGVETAYLQLVLARIWDDELARGSTTLRLETLAANGGAGEIVRSHVRRALDSLDPRERDVAATIFNYLVTPSGTKIAHSLADLEKYSEGRAADVDSVVAALSRDRVLRSVAAPGEGNGHSSGYEIFHDVLAHPLLAWRRQHDEERALRHERNSAARRHRRQLVVTATSLVALAVMTAVAVYALGQRSQARDAARSVKARELSAQALVGLDLDQHRALRLAADAARLERTPATEDVLRRALLTSHQRRTFITHGPALTARWSPSGRELVTTSREGELTIWNPFTAQVQRRKVIGSVVAVEYDASGTLLLTASDRRVRLEDARAGRLRWAVGRGTRVQDATRGGEHVIVGWADGRVDLLRPSDGKRWRTVRIEGVPVDIRSGPSGDAFVAIVREPNGHVRAWLYDAGRRLRRLPLLGVSDAEFSPDGTLVATTSRKRTTKIWRASDGTLVHTLSDDGGSVVDGAFSPDGRFLATASSDGVVRLWDVRSGNRVFFFGGHTSGASRVAFDPLGKYLASASADQTVRVWQVTGTEAGLAIAVLAGHDGVVADVEFAPDGRSLASASGDGTVRVWAADFEQRLTIAGRANDAITEAIPGPARAIVAGSETSTEVFGPQGRRVLGRGPVEDVASGAGGRLIAVGRADGIAELWTDGGIRLARLHHGVPVVRVALTTQRDFVLTAGGRSVRVWLTPSGTRVVVFPHPAAVTDAAFDPDGTLVATASTDGRVRVWRVATGKLEQTFKGHRGAVVRVRWSPLGNVLLTAGSDGTARLWRVRGGLFHVLSGHLHALTDARFDPSGRRIVTSSVGSSRNLIEWDAATGRRLHVLVGHFGPVRTASFSVDGRWIVSAGPIAAAIWHASDGRRLAYLRGHDDLLTDAEWSPTGYRVVTSALDRTVRTYECEVCKPLAGLLQLADERLAALEARGG